MLLLEHNAKELFRWHGIPTPHGAVVRAAGDLARVLDALAPPLALKAQIASGRRGRSGGIAFANSAKEAHEALAALLGREVDGHPVAAVLVEERIEFERERYAGLIADGDGLWLLFARSGGVDIEDITAADPANVISIPLDPVEGPTIGQLQDGFARLGYAPEYWAAYERIGRSLFAMSRAYDATLVEINPLVERANQLMALDARVAIDDAALDRQPAIMEMQPHPDLPVPAVAALAGLKFRQNPRGGAIGLLGLGGGLNVTLMDWIAGTGSQVGMLVDIDDAIGAGKAEQGFTAALEAFDRNASIKSVLINIITCGYRLDEIVAALLVALDRPGEPPKPVILHLRGNREAHAQQLLAAAGRANSASMIEAIDAVVTAAKT